MDYKKNILKYVVGICRGLAVSERDGVYQPAVTLHQFSPRGLFSGNTRPYQLSVTLIQGAEGLGHLARIQRWSRLPCGRRRIDAGIRDVED